MFAWVTASNEVASQIYSLKKGAMNNLITSTLIFFTVLSRKESLANFIKYLAEKKFKFVMILFELKWKSLKFVMISEVTLSNGATFRKEFHIGLNSKTKLRSFLSRQDCSINKNFKLWKNWECKYQKFTFKSWSGKKSLWILFS